MNDIRTTTSEGRVLKADRRARTLLLASGAIGALVVAVLTLWVVPWGQGYLQEQEPRVALRVLQGITALLFLSFVPAGTYLFWFGRRAVRSRQMPPPGTWVIRDTRVIEGDRAVRRGRGMMALAVTLFAICVLASLWLPYQFGKAFADKLQPSAGPVDQTDGNQPTGELTP